MHERSYDSSNEPSNAAAGSAAQSRHNTSPSSVEKRLSIGAENDAQENEADAMAIKVVRMPIGNGIVQRKPLGLSIQKKEDNNSEAIASNAVTGQINATKGSGSDMDGKTRSFMENRFGTGFSHVKIHTGSNASQLADQLNAKAFTVGNNVYFNQGKYAPETTEGKHLLAHELTHTVQQSGNIQRSPKDAFGRPLGFVPTPEQEQYDKDTHDIKEWENTLARLEKGELDDRDLGNARLRNRLTGLTTAEVNALITKIEAYQQKNPAVDTAKIIEYLQVRKEIATPMPDGATVQTDPITNSITSYSFTANNVLVRVVPDSVSTKGNSTGPTTNLGRSYAWKPNKNHLVGRLVNTEDHGHVAVNPTQLIITIQTKFLDNANGPSGYGKGTTQYDKEEKTTTLRAHEGKHGTDYIDYIKNTPFPVDISKGIVGVVSAADMHKIDDYISNITKASCKLTDQVGFTQNEFLKTKEGKASGIKSCGK